MCQLKDKLLCSELFANDTESIDQSRLTLQLQESSWEDAKA